MRPPDHLRILIVASAETSVEQAARDLTLLDEHIEAAIRFDHETALTFLERTLVDIAVLDLPPAREEATRFLQAIQQHHPHVLRFVLVDNEQTASFFQGTALAHQILRKPVAAAELHEIARAAVAALHRLDHPALTSAITRITHLPSTAALRANLPALLINDDVDLELLEQELERDPATAAKLMQVANSAYYGSRYSVSSLGEAISLLGLDTVRGIVMTARLYQALQPSSIEGFPIDALWSHCVYTGVAVRHIARHLRINASANRVAFTAALLHDVGKLIMAQAFGPAYVELLRQQPNGRTLWQEEFRRFGHHHGEVGACFLDLWGLPRAVVDAVALHHTPHRSREEAPGPVALVHLANAIVHAQQGQASPNAEELDSGFLQRLLLPTTVSAWTDALAAA